MDHSLQRSKPSERNFFELFGLEPVFGLDLTSLDKNYREMQMRVHPDKFARASSVEQRQAAQWAALANEAYQTLRQPLTRAHYLVQLNNCEPSTCKVSGSFLAKQMDLRETLATARQCRDVQTIQQLDTTLHHDISELQGHLALQLDNAHDYARAAGTVQMLLFLDKLAREVGDALEALEEALENALES